MAGWNPAPLRGWKPGAADWFGSILAPMAGNAFNPGVAARQDKRTASLNEVRALIRNGALAEAEGRARQHLNKHKKDADALFLLAAIAERRFRFDEAREHVTRALDVSGPKKLAPKEELDAVLMLFRLERHEGNTDAALRLVDRALSMKPGFPPFLIQRAGALEEAGRYDEAREVVMPLLEAFDKAGREKPPTLLHEFGKLLVHEKDYVRAVEVIDAALGAKSTAQETAVMLHFLRAKALDRAGRYAEAWESATRANDLGRRPFDPQLAEDQVTALIKEWSPERVEKFPISACEDELPVFVAGMPRSGTSLIDQIIDAHPKAAGVGENDMIEAFSRQLAEGYDESKPPPACFGRFDSHTWTAVAHRYCKAMRKLAPSGAERVVNKALGNNKMVGLLARLFPRTRIIHAMRDPRDVAVSCYMGWFNNQMHAWTTKIEWASLAWAQSERMMEHWRKTLDVPILDVRYEELVSDPETQFPRLIEFLGLEWDDRCFEFHKTRRTVRTLSYDQVNKPLYTTSAGRHRNYAEQLEGVDFPAY